MMLLINHISPLDIFKPVHLGIPLAPVPDPLPIWGPRELFQLVHMEIPPVHVQTYSLCSQDMCRQTESWHSTEMPSCYNCSNKRPQKT